MPDTLVPFTMPSLGADMEAGTILEWRVAAGATVHRGDVIAVVQTDKSDLDVEVFADGTVVELVVPEGEKVPVGTVLARLAPSGALTPSVATSLTAAPDASVKVPSPTPRRTRKSESPGHTSSPVLRHLAEQLGVKLDHVHGSGPGGRVTRSDVEHAASRTRLSPRARRLAREHGVDTETLTGHEFVSGDDVLRAIAAPTIDVVLPPPAAEAESLSDPGHAADTMRRAISRLMTKAWQEIPHYRVGLRLELSGCLQELATINDGRSAARRVLPSAVLAHAAARAAATVPGVNGHWRDGTFVPSQAVHLAVVVALHGGGLLAPVIHDAADKSLDAFMGEMRDLVTRARTGRLRASEVAGATFTITQLGDGEVDEVTPIIHPPQVAILGLGAIHDEPWAENGMLAARPVVHATLAGDHRAIDGRIGSAYLNALKRCLQESTTP